MKQNKQKKDVAVMTVAYNKKDVVEQCICALIHAGMRSRDVYVIDNGSTDDIQSVAQKHSVHYLRLDKNRFISYALNIGFSHFKIAKSYQYFLITGSDVLVNKQTVTEQVKTIEAAASIGMTGPAHYDIESNVLMNYGVTINTITSMLQSELDIHKRDRMNHFHSMYMIRSELYEKLGGLDDVLFPMIFEEPDLGERIRAKGFVIRTSPNAKIWHSLDHASTIGSEPLTIRKERLCNTRAKAYLFFRNRIIYMRKHTSFPRFILFLVCIHPFIALYYLPSIRLRHIAISMTGIIDGIVFALRMDRAYISKRNAQILHI